MVVLPAYAANEEEKGLVILPSYNPGRGGPVTILRGYGLSAKQPEGERALLLEALGKQSHFDQHLIRWRPPSLVDVYREIKLCLDVGHELLPWAADLFLHLLLELPGRDFSTPRLLP